MRILWLVGEFLMGYFLGPFLSKIIGWPAALAVVGFLGYLSTMILQKFRII